MYIILCWRRDGEEFAVSLVLAADPLSIWLLSDGAP